MSPPDGPARPTVVLPGAVVGAPRRSQERPLVPIYGKICLPEAQKRAHLGPIRCPAFAGQQVQRGCAGACASRVLSLREVPDAQVAVGGRREVTTQIGRGGSTARVVVEGVEEWLGLLEQAGEIGMLSCRPQRDMLNADDVVFLLA